MNTRFPSVPHRWTASILSTLLAFVAAPDTGRSQAIDEINDAETIELEEFTITGSNIVRHVEVETELPVSVIDLDELDMRGAATPAELFDTITFANPPALNEEASAGQSARGDHNAVDLRGLGSGSTLTLLNGRRMNPHPISASENGVPSLSVNANSLPAIFADRIEILRDGASAVYGSDAAAGVVNYLISPRFNGLQTRIRATTTSEDGAEEYRFSVKWGNTSLNDGRTRVLLFADILHREPLLASQRSFSADRDHRRTHDLPPPYDGVPVDLPDGGSRRENDFDGRSSSSPWGNFIRGTYEEDGSIDGGRPDGNVGIVTDRTSDVMTVSSSGRFYLVPLDSGLKGFTRSTPSRNIEGAAKDYYFNRNEFTVLLPETNRLNLGGMIQHELNENLTAFGEIFYYSAVSDTSRQPVQIDKDDAFGVAIGADNPFNPFGSRFYDPNGLPNPDGTRRLTGTPSAVIPDVVVGNGFRKREIHVRSTSYRVVAGLRGDLSDSWKWESALLYGSAHSRDVGRHNIRESRLQEALRRNDSSAYNPFKYTFKINEDDKIVIDQRYTNPAGLIDWLEDDYVRDGWTSLASWDGKITGDLFHLFGKPVSTAFGGDIRRETYKFRVPPYAGLNPPDDPNPYLRENDNDFILLSPNIDMDADRTVYSAYAELYSPLVAPDDHIPLIHGLDISAAVRYERFPGFGGATKPKAGIGYSMFRWLKFRGSYNESFRAPNLVQTNTQPLQRFTGGISDDYRFEVTQSDTDGATGRTVLRQGNAELEPEEAKTYTAGVVIDVPGIRGLSLTADYYNIAQSNRIDNVGGNGTLSIDEEFLIRETQRQLAAGTPIDQIDLGSGKPNYKGYSKVTRKPVTDADKAAFAAYNATVGPNDQRAPVGEVVTIIDDYINQFGRDLEGVDFGIEYRTPKTGIGSFTIRGEGSRRLRYDVQEEEDAPPNDNLFENGIPKWRFNGSIRWRKDNMTLSWSTYYYGAFVDTSTSTTEAVYEALGRPSYINPFNNNGSIRYLYEVKPYIYSNITASYAFRNDNAIPLLKGSTIRFGVYNIFDRDPSVADETNGWRRGTANPRGRRYWLEWIKNW